ncbi:NADH-quinone oxidoreductase subunit C [Acetonema longum]|uniref:NADH dehydrogenase (Ubiquinone) 30 kDa subunit n=1 Tax=Acetonema longum DSM 6540 TaxID=1009370 RepID=F7NI28_9FIRM|nr:NADH-quinone oxidoreductase subunit C [Acetonema longum]EGO64260.1 NADH dehydrogenase (ubiquinone) 30 kDa subunit [Acetonema longum DSM 6540]
MSKMQETQVHTLEATAANFRVAANTVYKNGQRMLSAMFANDERQIRGAFAIYCIFTALDEPQSFHVVKATLPAEGPAEFPSLTPIIPAAAWYEREIHDLFGLNPLDHPDLRPLVLHENWPAGLYPLRKDFPVNTSVLTMENDYPTPQVTGEGVFEVPVGPIHAGIIEPGHFRFSQAGEHMIHLEAKLFYTHRGIEKAVEGIPLDQAIFQVERICGACSVSNALSYSQAVEALTRTAAPGRAQYLRILAAELERLYNHVGDVGNICAGLGFAVGTSHGSRLKEKLMRLNEALTGNRFLRGWIVPGGVAMDLTRELSQDIHHVLRSLEGDFRELIMMLKDSEAFRNRVETTGIVPRHVALDLSLVGVAARASGVSTDMRRDFPYSGYAEFEFKVPVYKAGDVAARLGVRAEEAFQSIGIIREVLAKLARQTGPLRAEIGTVEPYRSAFGWSESARGGNLHWVMAGTENRIYRLFVRSASYPNWPALAVAVPQNIIPDFPLINKSFELCYACLDR